MNMKRITDVPVIEELGENSYVLVNNNGEAAQISGSKVGGGGGELPMLYFGHNEDDNSATSVFYDKDFTQPVDSAAGLEILMQRPMICKEINEDGDFTMVVLAEMQYRADGKFIKAKTLGGEDWGAAENTMLWLYFSDSIAE